MRVAHYLIREPSGLFYFRLRVPLDLRSLVGRRLIKRATGVRCPRRALAIATAWAARYAHAFEVLRGQGMMDKKLADQLLKGIRQRGAMEYEMDLSRGYLKTDGPEDHALAMAAIGAVSPAMRAEWAALPPACEPLDMDEAIRMWALTLPQETPAKRKASKAYVKDAEAFAAWKQKRVGAPFLISAASRTEFAEYFIVCKASPTSRGTLPAPRTVENKFLRIADLFEWAMTSDFYPGDDNPALGHANVPKKERKRRAKTHGWQAFTVDQVRKIFNPETYTSLRTEAARWLPVMALYTGARSNELAHLEIADCYNYAGNAAVPVFHFNFLGDHKSLKTDASERLIPVHADLIALGLWERVKRLREAGETKLFPDLTFLAENGPANAAQKTFSRYLERLEIEARGSGKVGLHSFRDTAISTMKLANVPREAREEYCGHEINQRGSHDESYGVDLQPPTLAKLCHPALSFGLDLPALRKLLI